MTDNKAGKQIPTLDGLRAISFLIVFVSHTGLIPAVPGGFGVTVFFFLSGYLITTLMRREMEKSGTVSLRNFYIRRALRILPPFYLVLAVASIMTEAGAFKDVTIEWKGVAAQVFHFSNYWLIINHWPRGQAPGTPVFWSLAVEEHFYLLFPLIFLAFWRARFSARAKALSLLGVCAVILLWRIYLVSHGSSPERTNMGSDTRFDSILFGCILAFWNNPALEGRDANTFLWRNVLLPLGVAGLVFSFVYRSAAFRETFRYTLQGLCLIPVFVAGVRWPTMLPFRLLNWRPVAFMGVLSYSLYLVHFVVLRCLEANLATLSPVVRAALALAISLLLAYLIYVTIEKPCARLRKRFGHG